ncbi:MAG: hypothetical protein KBC64_02795 [Simkaniaceae bacterium]|nr:hypothetical protein [Simkaniaceae bacterium]
MDILNQIAESKKKRIPSFYEAIKRRGVIAEIKKKSPSAGEIKQVDVVAQAKKYERAIAVSVLTDASYFGGSLDDLNRVRESTSLPVLRKDFIVERGQLTEVRSSAVLLIVAILQEETASFIRLVEELSLDALVEVNNEKELEIALTAGASLIAINHRNLRTFEVDPQTSLRLAPLIPQGVLKVAASGIYSIEEARNYFDHGFDAVLVGEALMKSSNPSRMIELMKRQVKICGVTDPETAYFAALQGASYVGLVFHQESHRYVDPSQGKQIAEGARKGGAIPVGVFTHQSKEEIIAIAEEVGLTHLQLHGDRARESYLDFPSHYTLIYVVEVDEKGSYEIPQGLNQEKDYVLYDSMTPGKGVSFLQAEWKPCKEYPFFIAGGITPLNVKEKIAHFNPDGIDVSSGVEKGGVKDKQLIEALIRKC